MMKIKLEFALVISWAAVALSQIDFPGNTGTGNNRGQSVVSFLRHENRALTSRQRYGNECRLNRNTVGYCRFIDDEECERPRELMERSRRSRRQRRRARRLLRRRIKSPCGYQDHDYTLCCPGDVPSGPPSNPVIECGKRQEEASNSRRRLQRSPSPTPQDLIPSNFQDSPNTVFIVGGFESADNAWPFTVALGQVNSKDLSFNVVCGGTLISKKHVLTAAHCFPSRPTPAQKITHVRAGKQDLLNPVPIGSFTDASICRTHVHEDFTLIGGAHNDVALVELCQDVTFGQTIQPACLPASQNSKEYQRRTLTVVGWGSESEGGATVDRLRETEVEFVPNSECSRRYSSRSVSISEKHICAGRGNHDACAGDSGGPLFVNINDHWYVTGITSFGIGCGSKDFPGVWANVAQYLPWINSKM